MYAVTVVLFTTFLYLILGSYFARDAKYSHSYTSDSGTRCMFVCRILVGDFTKGNSTYLRPPSKDGGDTVFFDSCVDNVHNPSIFVVFEKHQIYPEYLIQYSESYQASASATPYYAPTQRPAPVPRPVPTPRPTPAYGIPQQAHLNSYATTHSYSSSSSATHTNSSSKSDSDSLCVIS